MSSDEKHKITWLNKEFHRHQLINHKGTLIRGRPEFVETDPDQELEYVCECGEYFESKSAAKEHLLEEGSSV